MRYPIVLTAILSAALLLAAPLAAPGLVSAASPITRTTETITHEFSVPLGPEAACFGVAPGTPITGTATTVIVTTTVATGPNAGRYHVQVKTAGTFRVEASGTTYTGTFASQATELGMDGVPRVLSVRNPAHGSSADGTPLRLNLHSHLTRDAHGTTRVDVSTFTCAP